MFKMYFKAEVKADIIYKKMLPFITVFNIDDEVFDDLPPELTRGAKRMVSIQKLSKFIDAFNFYPVRVNKIKSKNASTGLTYVMSSGYTSSLINNVKVNDNDVIARGIDQATSDAREKARLYKLLSLVSEKLTERFANLRTAFRYLDTDHSQSISLNEFAQAIDFLRLKISFEDIRRLYRFMDKDGSGDIGYEEFTMLTEERWRGIDPFQVVKENQKAYDALTRNDHEHLDTIESTETTTIPALNDDQHKFHRLEHLSKNHLKIPLK